MSIKIKQNKFAYMFYNGLKKYYKMILLLGIILGIIVLFRSGYLESFFTKRLIIDYKYTPWSDSRTTNSQQPNNSEVSEKNKILQKFILLEKPDSEGYNFFHEGLGFKLKLPQSIKVKIEQGQVELVDEVSQRVIAVGSMGGFHSMSFVSRDACESIAMEDGRELNPFEQKGCYKINNAHALKWEFGHQKGDCLGMGCEVGEVNPSVTTTSINVEWTFIRNPYDRNSVNFSYSTEGDDFREQQIWFDDLLKTFKFSNDLNQENTSKKNLVFKNGQFSFEYSHNLPLFLTNKNMRPGSYTDFIEGCMSSYNSDTDSVCLYYPNEETQELGFKGGGFAVSRLVDMFATDDDKIEKCLYEARVPGTVTSDYLFKGFSARKTESSLPDAKIKVHAIYAHNHCYKVTQSVFFNENKTQSTTDQKLSEYTNTVWNELDEILNTLTFYE